MPKTLPKNDPNLLNAVNRLGRVQTLWGWLLIGLGVGTQFTAGLDHPVAGLPFFAVGVAVLRWGDPALLATVATMIGLSIVSTVNAQLGLLGPDPIRAMLTMSNLEVAALVIGKILIVLTASNQFFFYRLLYGTALATSDEPNLPIIPPMVPNRTNGLARWGRWVAFGGAFFSTASLLLAVVAPAGDTVRVTAEMGGSLGAVALGLGLGAAFSPTDEREAALWSISLGLVSYIAAGLILMRLT